MRDLNFYRFRSVWEVDARTEDAYTVLEKVGDYPAWWPEVTSVRRLGEDVCEVRCRSLLPYELVFTSRHARRDPVARVLEARLSGDLEGFSRWTILPSSSGSSLIFDEEVVVTKALLRRLAVVARPAFKANHALMMSHGLRGLRTYLAGYRLASRGSGET